MGCRCFFCRFSPFLLTFQTVFSNCNKKNQLFLRIITISLSAQNPFPYENPTDISIHSADMSAIKGDEELIKTAAVAPDIRFSSSGDKRISIMPRRKVYCITEEDKAAIHCIARNAVGAAGITYGDLGDVEQELAITLTRKAHLYRRRKFEWSTFRRAVLSNRLKDIINARMQPGSRPDHIGKLSLDQETISENDGDVNCSLLIDMVTTDGLLADNTEKPELPGVDLKIDMHAFMKALSPKYRKICRVLKTHSLVEAVQILKISRTTLYRHTIAIKKEMKKAGLDIYISPQNETLF